MSKLTIEKSYRTPLILALLLHGLIILIFTVNVSEHRYRWQSTATTTPIVQATTINTAALNRQIHQIKAEQTAQQRQKIQAVHRLEQQALAMQRRRISEQQRLQHLQAVQTRVKQQQLAQLQLLHKQQAQAKQAQVKAQQWREKLKKLQQQALVHQREELQQQRSKLQQQLLAQQLQAEQQQMKQQQQALTQASNAGVLDKYRAQILEAIQHNWHPLAQNAKLYCQLLVHVAPGGVVTAVDLVKSSGDSVLDRSAKLAILKASPLPVPQDQALFDRFRQFRIKMSPQDIKGVS